MTLERLIMSNRPSLSRTLYSGSSQISLALICLKLVLTGLLVSLTNFGFWERVSLLVENSRWTTLVPFLGIWAIALAALLVAAFQTTFIMRLLWAIPIALSSTAAWAYYQLSQSDLTVFDVITLWSARHEAGRAAEFNQHLVLPAILVCIISIAILAAPPGIKHMQSAKWLRRLAWLPALPILLIAAVVQAKSGGGSEGMPKQYSALALSVLAAEKIATQGTPSRKQVTWTAETARRVPHVIMLVDESIRGDYIDLTPNNPHTPEFARLAGNFVNFGPAASGGDCSNYSNAILRFMASRVDLARTATSNPTVWQYAKEAGYRTVFIDAQAGVIKNPGLLQNFMSVKEKANIDSFHLIQDVASDQADFRLIDIINEELAKPGPVFIYANKNGAHFPYDRAYPASQAVYHPTITETGEETATARTASYRNAIRWSVDQFMKKLFETVDLSRAAMIYTSDHAQLLEPGKLTHCIVENPDPKVALVPLMAYAADADLKHRFEMGAAANRGKASHFLIAPTLLELMGYGQADISTAYDESLFTATPRAPAFTTGDIFGLFSEETHWYPLDLAKDYREPPFYAVLPETRVAQPGTTSIQ
jgi:glucan phosphoethanolaminetransferase (alkaline phosphatase superfamily)